MAYILVRHAVEEYDEWKPVFDDHADEREGYGSLGGFVGHVAGEHDDVVIVMEWDDVDRAREFAESETLRDAMREAGVVGAPDVTFLDETEPFER